jgi:hypothetical protein
MIFLSDEYHGSVIEGLVLYNFSTPIEGLFLYNVSTDRPIISTDFCLGLSKIRIQNLV